MDYPKIASKDEWLAARVALLKKEKAFDRERDALSAERRNLPMVKIEKAYTFDGPEGKVTLEDLFSGKPQLVAELPGASVFLRKGNDVFHTYSTFSRGLDHLIGTYNYLDLTPLGRNEKGLKYGMEWVRLHDRY
jgi:predicted dithiol-disulfide oxidoreductase (DUF899 family)